MIHWRDRVFAGNHPVDLISWQSVIHLFYELTDQTVQLDNGRQCGGAVRSIFLGCVIQVRKVDVEKIWLKLRRASNDTVCDPLRRIDVSQWPPEMFERKMPQLLQ